MTKERELLEETLLFLDEFEYPTIVEEIRAFLAAEEQYDALRERYVEGLGNSMKDCKESFEREAERVKELLTAEPEAEPALLTKEELESIMLDWMNTPKSRNHELYVAVQQAVLKKNLIHTRPEPARKPITEEEIKAEAQSEKFNRCDAIVFAAGIRFAEKHHGIGGDDD